MDIPEITGLSETNYPGSPSADPLLQVVSTPAPQLYLPNPQWIGGLSTLAPKSPISSTLNPTPPILDRAPQPPTPTHVALVPSRVRLKFAGRAKGSDTPAMRGFKLYVGLLPSCTRVEVCGEGSGFWGQGLRSGLEGWAFQGEG